MSDDDQARDMRAPSDHTAALVNGVEDDLQHLIARPDGLPRELTPEIALGISAVRGYLAVASSLLAVAESIRESGTGRT